MLTRENFIKAADKAGEWKEKFTKEELGIITLWLAGHETEQISRELQLPVSRVKIKIHGVNRWFKGSVYKRVLSLSSNRKQRIK